MSVLSLLDDSFKSLLTNSISLKYLTRYGYSKHYNYMDDNLFCVCVANDTWDDENVRIMKVQTIDTVNNIWFIGYKDYSKILSPHDVFVGRSITPTQIGECSYTEFNNIVFDTATVSTLNKPDNTYYELINYWKDILNGYVESCGHEDEYNMRYRKTYLFDVYIENRLDFVKLAACYHLYNLLHENRNVDTILNTISYSPQKEEHSIYNQLGINLNKFEKIVSKIRYYLGKM